MNGSLSLINRDLLSRKTEPALSAGKIKLAAKVKHVSKEYGDGTGYDIGSFDQNGNEILIEVKTTRGAIDQPFYITRNELERSLADSDKYYLYRVYNFDEEANLADLHINQGSLKNLCDYPALFKTKIRGEKE